MGWSREELLHELLIVPRRAFLPWSGTQVIEGPGWLQLITPTFRQGGLNEVVFSQLDAREADAVIDATIARYRELGLRFRWTLAPGCQPDDMAQRLEQRGLERVEALGMVRELDELPERDDADVSVELVSDATFSEYLTVMATGWGVDPEPLAALARAQLADPSGRFGLFLARWRGQPAAAAACIAFERSLYLQGGVVLPEFRRRGVYRALTSARLRHSVARGLGLATVHAQRSTSGPLLQRFGFRTLVEFPTYRGH